MLNKYFTFSDNHLHFIAEGKELDINIDTIEKVSYIPYEKPGNVYILGKVPGGTDVYIAEISIPRKHVKKVCDLINRIIIDPGEFEV